MSSFNEIFNGPDDLHVDVAEEQRLRQEHEEKFGPASPVGAPSGTAARVAGQRTSLDDVLDAVNDKVAKVDHTTCPVCKAEGAMVTRRPLSKGVVERVCRQCRVRIPVASVASQTAPDRMRSTRKTVGPFTGSPRRRSAPSPLNPSFRIAAELGAVDDD